MKKACTYLRYTPYTCYLHYRHHQLSIELTQGLLDLAMAIPFRSFPLFLFSSSCPGSQCLLQLGLWFERKCRRGPVSWSLVDEQNIALYLRCTYLISSSVRPRRYSFPSASQLQRVYCPEELCLGQTLTVTGRYHLQYTDAWTICKSAVFSPSIKLQYCSGSFKFC